MKSEAIVTGLGLLVGLGCVSHSHLGKVPSFPELNFTDTLVVYDKWHALDKYDRKQTKELLHYFTAPDEGYTDSLNCFAQARGHFRLHKHDYYIVDWSDS